MSEESAKDDQENLDELDQENLQGDDGVATDQDPDLGEGEEEGSEDTESGEMEVFLEGEESRPQKKKEKTFQDRINRKNRQMDKAVGAEKDRADNATRRGDVLEEENKLLRMSNDQLKQRTAPVKPNPDDFDEGFSDPKYVEQKDEYDDYVIDRKVDARIAKTEKVIAQTASKTVKTQDFETKAREHYKRADELKATDFGDTEDKAIEVMGQPMVDDIITIFPHSERLLYYLGKKPEEAAELKLQMDVNPAMAVFKLGEINAKLKIRRKSRDAPNPDEAMPGGGVPSKRLRGPKGATYK